MKREDIRVGQIVLLGMTEIEVRSIDDIMFSGKIISPSRCSTFEEGDISLFEIKRVRPRVKDFTKIVLEQTKSF